MGITRAGPAADSVIQRLWKRRRLGSRESGRLTCL